MSALGFVGRAHEAPVYARGLPPCSGWDDDADDQRQDVRLAFAFALGALRSVDKRRCCLVNVARLHEHQGTLYVVVRRPLPGDVLVALRQSWEQIVGQPGEMVRPVDEADADWIQVWSGKRFKFEGSADASH